MLNKEQLARLKKLDRLEPEAVEAVFKPRWNRHNLAAADGRSNGGPGRNSSFASATIPNLVAVKVAPGQVTRPEAIAPVLNACWKKTWKQKVADRLRQIVGKWSGAAGIYPSPGNPGCVSER